MQWNRVGKVQKVEYIHLCFVAILNYTVLYKCCCCSCCYFASTWAAARSICFGDGEVLRDFISGQLEWQHFGQSWQEASLKTWKALQTFGSCKHLCLLCKPWRRRWRRKKDNNKSVVAVTTATATARETSTTILAITFQVCCNYKQFFGVACFLYSVFNPKSAVFFSFS